MTTTNNQIELIKYSEKCYVLTGPGTKEKRHLLKGLKLKWNRNLKTKDGTGQKFGGWLVSINKVDQIKELFNLTVS